MNNTLYSQLQLREIFHIEFLRWFGRRMKPDRYAVKGGVNLRFFFGSIRYSEDMDLDIRTTAVADLREAVMGILTAASFTISLRPFGIERVAAPDMAVAKQTETTQRFKVHLFSVSGEDLFTKIEFSRRGFGGEAIVQSITEQVLRSYKVAPVVVPHYGALYAIAQKITALATRSSVQARDIFDLALLGAHYEKPSAGALMLDAAIIKKAHDNIFQVEYEQFKDTVLEYLAPEDREVYQRPAVWDDMRLGVSRLIAEIGGGDGA